LYRKDGALFTSCSFFGKPPGTNFRLSLRDFVLVEDVVPSGHTKRYREERRKNFLFVQTVWRNADFDIANIIPNTMILRGAIFSDIGNIWNLRNTKLDGSTDSAQFQLKNLYSQTGVSAGTGLRLDFNYFVLRLDFGFRFKRPELYYINDGWKAPDIGFDDAFKKIFTRGTNSEYRQWRYENFNFTIGIGYSF
jgi:hypothetical protein